MLQKWMIVIPSNCDLVRGVRSCRETGHAGKCCIFQIWDLILTRLFNLFSPQTSRSWVWRCCSVSRSTDAVKSAARASSAPPPQVRSKYRKIKCRVNKKAVQSTKARPSDFFPQCPSRRWSPVCPRPHPAAVTAMERGASVGGHRSTSPPRPGCRSDTSSTATSTQWTPPTERRTRSWEQATIHILTRRSSLPTNNSGWFIRSKKGRVKTHWNRLSFQL